MEDAILFVVGQALLTLGGAGIGAVFGITLVRSWNEIVLIDATIALVLFFLLTIGGQ